MENIVEFKAKLQKEYEEICEIANQNLIEYGKMLERKERKYRLKGGLSEADIDDIILGMATIAKDSREKHKLLKEINPNVAAYIEEIEKQIFKDAKEKYFEEEYHIRLV